MLSGLVQQVRVGLMNNRRRLQDAAAVVLPHTKRDGGSAAFSGVMWAEISAVSSLLKSINSINLPCRTFSILLVLNVVKVDFVARRQQPLKG